MVGHISYFLFYFLSVIASFISFYFLGTKKIFQPNVDELESETLNNFDDKKKLSKLKQSADNAVIQVFSVSSIFNWLQPFKTPIQVTAAGSGFFINEEGYFVTNSHVVDQAKNVWIQMPAFGRKNIDVQIISVCPDRDLALLKIKDEGLQEIKMQLGSIPFFKLGNSDEISRTDKVLVLGYPLGQHYLKATTGIVSGKEHISDQLLIQIDAAVNPGSSGGPVLDDKGEVIGITTVMVPMAQNVGYIIPINELKNSLEDLYKVPFLRKQSLGISYSNSTPELVAYLNNPAPGGLYINKVYKDSIAQKAGIVPGDMLYEINENAIDTFGDVKLSNNEDRISFFDIVSSIKTGQNIDLVIYRKGERKEISFKFENAPVYPIRVIYPEYENVDYEIIAGIIVMELSENHVHTLFTVCPELYAYENPERQVESVLIISYLFPNSQAFKLRILNTCDIIKSVNDIPVKTLAEFTSALKVSLKTGYLIIKTQDSILVLNIHDVLKEEEKLAQDYKYPLSKTVQTLINENTQKK